LEFLFIYLSLKNLFEYKNLYFNSENYSSNSLKTKCEFETWYLILKIVIQFLKTLFEVEFFYINSKKLVDLILIFEF